jgi:BON domain
MREKDTPMMVGLKRISTAFGLALALASAASAQEAISQNQATANAVASTLRSSRNLAGYRIEIEAREGLVTVRGALETPAQKSEVIARTRSIAGVRGVIDALRVTSDRAVSPVMYQPGGVVTGTVPGYQPGGVVPGTVPGYGRGPFNTQVTYGTGTSGPMAAGSLPDGSPMPEGPAGVPGATQAAQPGYPNYAWPSYAPYPNFSAVGYPTAYPWQAWPNIGPFYPYPEVPLDWRAVTLRWDDGIWWLDFKKHYTRPFFTPYPFGLFAY